MKLTYRLLTIIICSITFFSPAAPSGEEAMVSERTQNKLTRFITKVPLTLDTEDLSEFLETRKKTLLSIVRSTMRTDIMHIGIALDEPSQRIIELCTQPFINEDNDCYMVALYHGFWLLSESEEHRIERNFNPATNKLDRYFATLLSIVHKHLGEKTAVFFSALMALAEDHLLTLEAQEDMKSEYESNKRALAATCRQDDDTCTVS